MIASCKRPISQRKPIFLRLSSDWLRNNKGILERSIVFTKKKKGCKLTDKQASAASNAENATEQTPSSLRWNYQIKHPFDLELYNDLNTKNFRGISCNKEPNSHIELYVYTSNKKFLARRFSYQTVLAIAITIDNGKSNWQDLTQVEFLSRAILTSNTITFLTSPYFSHSLLMSSRISVTNTGFF